MIEIKVQSWGGFVFENGKSKRSVSYSYSVVYTLWHWRWRGFYTLLVPSELKQLTPDVPEQPEYRQTFVL